MNETTIVPISENEFNELLTISKETFWDTFAPGNTKEIMDAYMKEAFEESKMRKELKAKDSWFYFIKQNGVPVGYLKVNINDSQTEEMGKDAFEVQRIYIKKEYKRKGLGTKLMNFAFDLCKKHNKKFLWLGVWEYNPEAQSFYRKLGFVQDGAHTFMMGEDAQTDIIMKKYI